GPPQRPVRSANSAPRPGAGQGPALHPGGAGPQVFAGAVSSHHQSLWVCHLAQLPFLYRSGRTPEPGLPVGLRRAVAGGLGPRGAGGVSLSLRLARTQSQRHPRRRLLRPTLCVAPGLVGALDAPGILGALSPQAHGTSGSTALSGAAIVALRTCAHGVKPPSVPVRGTVNLFPHGYNGNYGEVWARVAFWVGVSLGGRPEGLVRGAPLLPSQQKVRTH